MMPSPEELKIIQEENMSEKQIEQSAVREENYNAGHEAGEKEAQESKQELEEMKKTDETESAEKHAALLKELKGEGNGETAEPEEGNKEKLEEELKVVEAEYEKFKKVWDDAHERVNKIWNEAEDRLNSTGLPKLFKKADYLDHEPDKFRILFWDACVEPKKFGPHFEHHLNFLIGEYGNGMVEKFKLKRAVKEQLKFNASVSEEFRAALNKVEGLKEENREQEFALYKIKEKLRDLHDKAKDELLIEEIDKAIKNKQPLDESFVKSANKVIHEKWLEKNGSWKLEEQNKPYSELSALEQGKNGTNIERFIKNYKKQLESSIQ